MNHLRLARSAKGLTQFDLVLKTGINSTRISHIENNEYEATESEKEKLAAAIGVTVDKIFSKEEFDMRSDVKIEHSEAEKVQAAFDKLMGADVEEKYKSVPPFRSLPAAYTTITGDADFRGKLSREGLRLGEDLIQMMRLPAAYSTNSFSFVLGNSMYRRLAKEYNAVNYFEDALISFYREAENFKTMEIIQVGYFGDVPDVNPESADYEEITMLTNIEATYAINQKGWILTVTRQMILNDDVKAVTQLVSKMGRAYRRTHARRAWNKIINNAQYKGDSKNLFHMDHGNLETVALRLMQPGSQHLRPA